MENQRSQAYSLITAGISGNVPEAIRAAGELAAKIHEDAGLFSAESDDGQNVTYEQQQAYRSASYARQDAAAVLFLMAPVLSMLTTIKRVCWALLVIMLYIAYRVT